MRVPHWRRGSELHPSLTLGFFACRLGSRTNVEWNSRRGERLTTPDVAARTGLSVTFGRAAGLRLYDGTLPCH